MRFGGEYFVSDIHGEYRTFACILNDAFGPIKKLHVIGDVYDRGPAPDKIMDLLAKRNDLDIQWGNHDMVWMGASFGQRGCITHVVRNCARYGNLDILTDAYGIDLEPVFELAKSVYSDDPCEAFGLKVNPGLEGQELLLNMRVQKAMAILQFKVEAALIDEHPEFDLKSRKLLHKINYERNIVEVDGVEYELKDTYFPTVNKADPYVLTDAEEALMCHLEQAFIGSERLQRHVKVLFDHGSLYKIVNGLLLVHACVPLNDDASLKEVVIDDKICKGKSLYCACQEWVYRAFYAENEADRKQGRDVMWWLWLGQGSPLFAKSKMATFEIYLCRDKAARKEEKNAFYKLFDRPQVYESIFEDFGLDPQTARIICGHVPVKVKDGEDPIKACGKVICIDGGMSPAYQSTTGIGGYTLVDDGNDLVLYTLDPLSPQSETLHASGRRVPAL